MGQFYPLEGPQGVLGGDQKSEQENGEDIE